MDKQENQQTDAVLAVFERNQFYRTKYYWTLCAYLFSLVVIVILLVTSYYLFRHPVEPLYFVADKLGRLIEEVPVTQPGFTADQVSDWVVEAIQKTYSYNFVNYRAQMQDSRKYFTQYGWDNYIKGLTASNNIVALTQRNMVFDAHVIGKPQLAREGILGGAYAWRFEMQMLVQYLLPPAYDQASGFRNAYQVSVIVQRQNLLNSYKGLGIVQIIATLPTSGGQTMLVTPQK